jgi:hypothetical protein
MLFKSTLMGTTAIAGWGSKQGFFAGEGVKIEDPPDPSGVDWLASVPPPWYPADTGENPVAITIGNEP